MYLNELGSTYYVMIKEVIWNCIYLWLIKTVWKEYIDTESSLTYMNL